MTPLLQAAMDYTNAPDHVVWRDTNAMTRLEAVSAQLGTNGILTLGSLEKGTFADVDSWEKAYRGNTNYPQASSTATSPETVLVALGKFNSEIRELRDAASNRPYCRWPIHYNFEPSWAILLPHLSHMKGLTTLFSVRATAELEAGQPAEAFEDLKVGLRLSDSISREALLIDHLVRLSTLFINLSCLREGLVRHAWTDAQLAELQAYGASTDVLAEYRFAMRGERVFSVTSLDFLRRKGPKEYMQFMGNDEGGSSSAGNFNFMPSGWFYQNMLTISRMEQDYILAAADERAHRVFPDIAEKETHAIQHMRAGPYTIFAKMLLPALERAVKKSARAQVFVDAAQISCALERYRLANGALPESLDALTPRFLEKIPNDVIDGKPLRYRREGADGFLIYSVGWNEKDDGGVLGWKKDGKKPVVDPNSGDWVWRMGRAAETSKSKIQTPEKLQASIPKL
jgi:hypothetical protein